MQSNSNHNIQPNFLHLSFGTDAHTDGRAKHNKSIVGADYGRACVIPRAPRSSDMQPVAEDSRGRC